MSEIKKLNLIDEIEKLYESEINFSVATFFDSGYWVGIGDELNGWRASENGFNTFEEAIEFLLKKVLEIYPDSEYAKEKKEN